MADRDDDGRLQTQVLVWLACRQIVQVAITVGRALVDDGRWMGGVEAIWPPQFDEFNGWVRVGRLRGWLVCVAPMLVNNRLVLTPETDPDGGYDHGWCYPQGGKAIIALAAWRPDLMDEPPGAYKRVTRPPFTTSTRARGWL